MEGSFHSSKVILTDRFHTYLDYIISNLSHQANAPLALEEASYSTLDSTSRARAPAHWPIRCACLALVVAPSVTFLSAFGTVLIFFENVLSSFQSKSSRMALQPARLRLSIILDPAKILADCCANFLKVCSHVYDSFHAWYK